MTTVACYYTDHFSGSGRAIGPVCRRTLDRLCICLCVRGTVTLELNDLWPRHLACWFVLTKVKVTG